MHIGEVSHLVLGRPTGVRYDGYGGRDVRVAIPATGEVAERPRRWRIT